MSKNSSLQARSLPNHVIATKKRTVAALCLSAVCLAGAAGCGGNHHNSDADVRLQSAMKLLGLQYGGLIAERNGAAPADESVLRRYLKSQLTNLSDYGVTSADDLLPPGRDGQPLQVIYGTKSPIAERGNIVWVAYEQTAVDGIRFACDSRGGVYELTDEEFSRQLAN